MGELGIPATSDTHRRVLAAITSSKPVNLRWPQQWPDLVLHLLIRVAVLQGEPQEIPPWRQAHDTGQYARTFL
jgi:hypothetical protein